MGEPISTQKLGGVTYNANQFVGRELANGKYELKAKNGGERLIFSKQRPSARQAAEGEKADYYEYEDGTTGEKSYKDIDAHIDDNGNFVGYKSLKGIPMKNNNPRIEMSTKEGWIVDENSFTIADMMGATFSSSKDTIAHVKLENCESTTVDLAANRSRWYGDNAKIEGGQGNRVILDDEDSARINNKSVKGEGIADQKDYE